MKLWLMFCRTMQTAVGVFGGEGYTDAVDVLALMVANAGNSNRPAISTLACPPFIAVETCREHLVRYTHGFNIHVWHVITLIFFLLFL